MTLEFDIRSYESGDEVRIPELFRLSFGRNLDPARLLWRVKDNPAGAAVIGRAWDGDALMAVCVNTPVTLRVKGRDWSGALVGGVMTHPDHRGHGLFRELVRGTWAQMAEAGTSMVWGFTNPISHRRFIRDLEVVDVHEVPTFRLPLSQVASLPVPSDDIVELEGFDDRFDRLWERVRDDHAIITRRDQRHLQWRWVENPVGSYRILACCQMEDVLGYVVLKRYQEEVHVVDILTVSDVEVGVQLLSRAAQIAREGSASALSLWLNVSHALHWALEALGYCNGEPVSYFIAKTLRPELREAEVYDYRQWYLTMGDSDVF